MVWWLFIVHKLIMLYCGVSVILIILDKAKALNYLVLSGFFLSQSLLGNCIITSLENWVRSNNGFEASHNGFILSFVGNGFLLEVFRLCFCIVGLMLLMTAMHCIYMNKNRKIVHIHQKI